MGKVSFSHKIDDSFAECFEKMCDQLGPPKYRIIEAAIEVFDALPRDIQYRLKGLDPKERELYFKMLANLPLTPELPLSITPESGDEDLDAEIRVFARSFAILTKKLQSRKAASVQKKSRRKNG